MNELLEKDMKVYKLMDQYYVTDKTGPFKCASTREKAIQNYEKGLRPGGKVTGIFGFSTK